MSIVLHSDLVIKNGKLQNELVIEGNWRYSQSSMEQYAVKKEIYITRDLYLRRIVNEPRFKTLKDLLSRVGDNEDEQTKMVNINNLFENGWGSNEDADEEQRLLFGTQGLVSYPKPIRLLMKILISIRDKNCLILDFFSGSSTMAHAVMELNSIDNGNRKFIMVQLSENLDENLKKVDASSKKTIENAINFLDSIKKPHYLTEIGKERIRRAGEKIKEDNKDKEGIENLDIGFNVFRVADTNIRWFSEALKSDQMKPLEKMEIEKAKDKLDFNEGFTDIDVVYEILLTHRDIPLSTNVEKLEQIGNRTYIFADTVIVCLDETITEEMIDSIAAIEPLPTKIIFRDSAFGADISLKENTMIRLQAQMKKQSGIEKKAYRIEFI